jgi:hypothetical protein
VDKLKVGRCGSVENTVIAQLPKSSHCQDDGFDSPLDGGCCTGMSRLKPGSKVLQVAACRAGSQGEKKHHATLPEQRSIVSEDEKWIQWLDHRRRMCLLSVGVVGDTQMSNSNQPPLAKQTLCI